LTGLEEKLVHLDIGRQGAGTNCVRVVEGRISAKGASRDWLEKSALQLVFCARHDKRQRRKNRESDRSVSHGLRIKRIGDVICFTEPQRERQHDGLPDACKDGVGQWVSIVKGHWSRV